MCRSLSVAKGEATSETKVSEKERRFPAPAGEAASSSPQPQGSRGLAPGTRADARLTAHPGSGQSLPARRTTTVTPAPTPPTPSPPPPRCGLVARETAPPPCREAPPTPPTIGSWGWLSPPPPSWSPGHHGSCSCRAEGAQAIPTVSSEMPAGVREGGARRLLSSSSCAFKTFP